MKTSSRLNALTIPWPVLQAALVRLAILSVIASCCALVWWSVTQRLMPASRMVREKTQQMTSLANDVQRLETAWDALQAEQDEARFKRARSRLFTSEESLLTWQKETERQADALALQPSAQAGKSQPHPAASHDLSLLPVTVDIRPLDLPRSTNSPYRRVLHFAQSLDGPQKRIDVVELAVTGGSNSMQQVKLVLNVWAPEKSPR